MNSPVENIIQSIYIDKQSKTAVYLQIAQQLTHVIQRGELPFKTVLPGTRSVSRLLHINRNTAVSVYEELASQGWIEIVANKGAFIAYQKHKKTTEIADKKYPSRTNFSLYESSNLASPYDKSTTTYTFTDGQTDIRLHQSKQYSQWYNAALQRASFFNRWNNYVYDRVSFLKVQLCNYLNVHQQFSIQPTNILITRSSEMSLYLISQLLLKPKSVVLVADLSNFKANMIFSQLEAKVETIPVDDMGLNIDYIKHNYSKNSIRMVYCNARRHYPTTATLSEKRRKDLLKVAREWNFAIIEDDFDSDFQFDTFPKPALATQDTHGTVVYLGTIGKALFPALETGFIVAPENLITEVKNYYQMIDLQGDLVKEQIVAELIHQGEMYRQTNKKLLLYKERRDAMVSALAKHFKSLVTFHKPSGGLAFFIHFKKHIPLGALAQQLKLYDISLPKHLLYQTKSICAIRLGFGHLTIEEIAFTIEKFRKAYDDVTKQLNEKGV